MAPLDDQVELEESQTVMNPSHFDLQVLAQIRPLEEVKVKANLW